MAHRNAHMETSRRLLGKEFPEVHNYLDQFFSIYGAGHRLILHHQLGIEKVVQQFGEEAREAAELHVVEDVEPQEAALDANWRELRSVIPNGPEDYDEPLLHREILYETMEEDLVSLFGARMIGFFK